MQKHIHSGHQIPQSGTQIVSQTSDMHSTPRKRRLSTSTATPSSQRKLFRSLTRSKKSALKRTSAGGYRSLGSNAAYVSKIGKGQKQIRHKKPKITPAFKRKVKDALSGSIYGEYSKFKTFKLTPFFANSQQQLQVSPVTLFTPMEFLDSADVLFDKKSPTFSPSLSTTKWSNGYIRKDYIVDSWATYEVKNFSQRTYTIKMYNCAPKSRPQTDNITGASSTWINGLTEAYDVGVNPFNNTVQSLFVDPRQNATFNAHWKADVTAIVLSPGESHTFTVPGPKGIEIDYSKYFLKPTGASTATILPWDKFSRDVFFVYYLDLVVTDQNAVGRYTSGAGEGGGLGCELSIHTKMRVPDDAGFTNPATVTAGEPQQLNLKQPTRVKAYFGMTPVGVVVEVEDQNPTVRINPED